MGRQGAFYRRRYNGLGSPLQTRPSVDSLAFSCLSRWVECLVSSLARSRGGGSSRSVARSSQGLRSALSGGSSSPCCLPTSCAIVHLSASILGGSFPLFPSTCFLEGSGGQSTFNSSNSAQQR